MSGEVVAYVYDDSLDLVDECYTWEAALNYVMHEGMLACAVADDGHMSMFEAQTLYDSERERYMDCWR